MKKYLFFKNSAFPRIPCPDSPLPFGIFPRISTGTVTPLPQPPLRLQKTPLSPAKTAQRLLAPPEPPGCSENPSRFPRAKIFPKSSGPDENPYASPALTFFQSLSINGRNLKPKHTSEVLLRGLETSKRHPRIRQNRCAPIASAGVSLRGPSVEPAPTCRRILKEGA